MLGLQDGASTSGAGPDRGAGANSGTSGEPGSQDPWRKAAAEVARMHNARNPGAPMGISGEELAEVIRNAATGAIDVLQQSLHPPEFCARSIPSLLFPSLSPAR